MQGGRNDKLKMTIVMGFTLFATWFGAGNVIFPPFVARQAGSGWVIADIGFLLTDVGLSVLAVWVTMTSHTHDIYGVVDKVGRVPGKIMVAAIVMCIGFGVGIPRTATVTYEMGVSRLLPDLPYWLFGLIFFGVVLLVTLRPSKVVDIVGNYLTPVLLIVLMVLIVKGIISPIGEADGTPTVVPLREGLISGYQTMDGLGPFLPCGILVAAAVAKGYKDQNEVSNMTVKAGIIAGSLLALVYSGLAYLGATTSGISSFEGLDQAALLLAIVESLMGNAGVVLLTVIVLLACLTTAIGLTAIIAEYLEDLSGGRLKNKFLVCATVGISYAVSNLGLSAIISLAVPILSVMYAPMIVLFLTGWMDHFVDCRTAGCFAAYAAFFTAVLDTIGVEIVSALPFANFGLGWIVPAVVAGIIGAVAGKLRPAQSGAYGKSSAEKQSA